MTIATASWILAVQTFLITLFFVYVVKSIGLRLGWVDRPDDRKIHRGPIVTVGGLGIFLGLLTSFLVLFLWSGDAQTKRWDTTTFVITYREYAHLCLLFVSSVVLVAVGFWDDTKGTSPWLKLCFQVIAAAGFVGLRVTSWAEDFQLYIETVPLEEYLLRFVLLTGWIVLLLNAINLIDGLDGLAAGVVAIASFWLMMANRPMENHFLTWTCAMLLGACVAFLLFNFHPATMFMGDTGALIIALWIGAGSIEGDFKTISGLMLATPIVLLGIPILEVISSFGRRLKSRQKIFQADSQHMHHRLLKLGFRHRSIVLFYYGVTFLLGMLGYLIAPAAFNQAGDPIPRISDPKMVYGMLAVIGGGVFLGYSALVSVEKRFEYAILDITKRYEGGKDIDQDLHELVDEEVLEDEESKEES